MLTKGVASRWRPTVPDQQRRSAGRAGGRRRRRRVPATRVLKLAPDELVQLAPRLRSYLRTPTPAWPEVVNAAELLRSDLGVSKSLWGEACLAMGREKAAIAIAIVSAKGRRISGPGWRVFPRHGGEGQGSGS